MDLTTIITIIGEVGVLVGALVPVFSTIKKVANGTRCQLRSEMLRIYYRNHDKQEIRQYEFQNFVEFFPLYFSNDYLNYIQKLL